MFVCLNSKKTESWCHSVCLMAKDSERVKDTQCASSARCSSAVYSLPSILLGVCPSVAVCVCVCLCVFLFILPSFMFSPFLNTIMQSKGPHGTSWCQNDSRKPNWNSPKKKKGAEMTECPLFPTHWSTGGCFSVARCQRTTSSINVFIYAYIHESWRQADCLQKNRGRKISVHLPPHLLLCKAVCVCLCRHLGYLK